MTPPPSLAAVASGLRIAPAAEAVAALEEVELDEEAQPDDLALEPLDELDRALDRAAGGQQVVDDQDALAGGDGVAVDLEGVRAVLERVLDGDRLGRELAELADRHEAGVELVGHRRAEDEPARLHPDDDVDPHAGERLEHEVDGFLVCGGVLEQGRDVVEEDPWLREIGDLADLRAQLLGRHDVERLPVVEPRRRKRAA